jgi:PKD repeat protein
MRQGDTVRRWMLIGTLMTLAVTTLWLLPALAWTGGGGRGRTAGIAVESCPSVPTTPYFTIAYGTVQLDGAEAPAGTVVEAMSPRDNVVGCFEVSEPGHYGAMYIYGEDTSASPPIPGMRAGEEVTFHINGVEATASPVLLWYNDRELHQVGLSASLPSPVPDLTIQDMQVAPEVGLNEPIVVTVTIQNQSTSAVDHYFYTDIYVDHIPSGCGDPGWDYIRTNALGAGQSLPLTFTHPGFGQTGPHSFYVQVDSACQVAESNEGNNIDGPLRVKVVEGTPVPPPTADFTASPRSGPAPLAVQFTDLSAGRINTRLWAFGDGTSSPLQNPSHLYLAADTYTVTLAVSGPGGTDALTRTHYITTYTAVQAGFTAWPTAGLAPLTVVFTNTCTGDYTSSLWDFGDGVTSTLESPPHVYTAAAIYTVTLTASGLGGTDTLVRTNYISVYAPVQADFTAWPRSGVAPLVVAFTNLSSGDYATSLWDFGDGVTSTLTSPTHTYELVDVYSATLTVSGPGGRDTETKAAYITVREKYRVYLPLVLRQFAGTP